MPFPLHKSPQGLLELFRLRTLGRHPESFAEIVSPTVDVAQFYGVDLQVTEQLGPPVVAALPILVTLTATSPGRLLQQSALATMGAAGGNEARVRVGYRPNATSPFVDLGAQRILTPVAAASYSTVSIQSQPIAFPAGAQFFALLEGDAAGADHNIVLFNMFEDYGAP